MQAVVAPALGQVRGIGNTLYGFGRDGFEPPEVRIPPPTFGLESPESSDTPREFRGRVPARPDAWGRSFRGASLTAPWYAKLYVSYMASHSR